MLIGTLMLLVCLHKIVRTYPYPVEVNGNFGLASFIPLSVSQRILRRILFTVNAESV